MVARLDEDSRTLFPFGWFWLDSVRWNEHGRKERVYGGLIKMRESGGVEGGGD